MPSNLPRVTEYSKQRILTSQQIAEAYETDTKTISYNFSYNKKHYVLGKHYFALEGEDKKKFIKDHREIPDGLKRAKTIYLWTEKGAWLHAKSLNTDKAWEAYELLVDEYYRLSAIVQQTQNDIPTGFINNLWLKRSNLFLQHTKIPTDKFCVFEEIAHTLYTIEMGGIRIPEHAIPDGSVGGRWKLYARDVLHLDMSLVKKYPHHYPDQRGVVGANIYPLEWQGMFTQWFREVYIPTSFPEYMRYLKMDDTQIAQVMNILKVNWQIPGKKPKQIKGK